MHEKRSFPAPPDWQFSGSAEGGKLAPPPASSGPTNSRGWSAIFQDPAVRKTPLKIAIRGLDQPGLNAKRWRGTENSCFPYIWPRRHSRSSSNEQPGFMSRSVWARERRMRLGSMFVGGPDAFLRKLFYVHFPRPPDPSGNEGIYISGNEGRRNHRRDDGDKPSRHQGDIHKTKHRG